jgi:hypothetical protein
MTISSWVDLACGPGAGHRRAVSKGRPKPLGAERAIFRIARNLRRANRRGTVSRKLPDASRRAADGAGFTKRWRRQARCRYAGAVWLVRQR